MIYTTNLITFKRRRKLTRRHDGGDQNQRHSVKYCQSSRVLIKFLGYVVYSQKIHNTLQYGRIPGNIDID